MDDAELVEKMARRTPASGTTAGAPKKWLLEHASYECVDCLIWPFSRNDYGYGLVWLDGTARRAHRIMCEIKNGPPPTPKHEAAHSCGNGHLGCVHPEHLTWKTRTENQRDKVTHGTTNRGTRCGTSKLTEADIRAIRSATGTHEEIGSRFCIAPSTVSQIRRRDRWAWLE